MTKSRILLHPCRPYDEIDKIDREIPVEVVPRGARKQIFMTSDPSTDDVVNALRDVFTESLQGSHSSVEIDSRLTKSLFNTFGIVL